MAKENKGKMTEMTEEELRQLASKMDGVSPSVSEEKAELVEGDYAVKITEVSIAKSERGRHYYNLSASVIGAIDGNKLYRRNYKTFRKGLNLDNDYIVSMLASFYRKLGVKRTDGEAVCDGGDVLRAQLPKDCLAWLRLLDGNWGLYVKFLAPLPDIILAQVLGNATDASGEGFYDNEI